MLMRLRKRVMKMRRTAKMKMKKKVMVSKLFCIQGLLSLMNLPVKLIFI